MKKFDVIIIGGGASGLMCAISAKTNHPNISVAVLEKNPRVGKKLLSTGNGRCNLTNQNISSQKYCGSFKKQSKFIFSKYNTNEIISVFKKLGLMTYCDNDGRYYPVCRQASAVLDVLRFACDRFNINVFCEENIKSVKKADKNFDIKTDKDTFTAKKLVIACGSKAAPKLGGNSSCADYLKNFGHTFVPFSPALCPIKVKSDILKSLKGLRAIGKATLADGHNNSLKEEFGEIQFNDNALSGICICNLSLYSKKNYVIKLDLIPNISEEELIKILLQNKKLFGNIAIDNLMTGILQKRLSQAILKQSNIKDFSRLCNTLSEQEIARATHTVKNLNFEIIENAGFEQAQAARGGVAGNEIDEKTMESKIVKNLYVCGEAVDICGECGGFNLHFAFASGMIAGENL